MSKVTHLNNHEPRIKHIKLENIKPLEHGGIYSKVWVATAPQLQYGGEVLKDVEVVIKRYKAVLSELPKQLEDFKTYSRLIDVQQATTRLSTLPNYNIEIDEDAQYIYFVDQKSTTPDLAAMLFRSDISEDDKNDLLSDLFDSLTAIPYDDRGHTSFMIDGKFSNFCPADGGFKYIDLFPAHIREEESGLLKPAKDHLTGRRDLYIDSFITGDIHGIISRFWGMLKRDYFSLWLSTRSYLGMQHIIEKLPPELRAYCVFLLRADNELLRSLYQYEASHLDASKFLASASKEK